MVLVIVLSSFARFIFAKSYIYHVEIPCDSTNEICYTRSCDDYCPPNGLGEYKVYSITASDFKYCTNNSCANICESTQKCKKIECNSENGDSCKP